MVSDDLGEGVAPGLDGHPVRRGLGAERGGKQQQRRGGRDGHGGAAGQAEGGGSSRMERSVIGPASLGILRQETPDVPSDSHAAPTCPPAPAAPAAPLPRLATSFKYARTPSYTPSAYIRCPSGVRSADSCSGMAMNIASVRMEGIQVGRTRARSPLPTPRSRRASRLTRAACTAMANGGAPRLVVEDAGAAVGEGVHPVGEGVVVDGNEQVGVHAVGVDRPPGRGPPAVSVVRVISTSAPPCSRSACSLSETPRLASASR